jgi:hypothetical protein
MTASGRPILLIVDADEEARIALESALARRFGADYGIMTAGSADEGIGVLEFCSAADLRCGLEL